MDLFALSRQGSRRRSSSALTYEQLAKMENENRTGFSGRQLESSLHNADNGWEPTRLPIAVPNESASNLLGPNRRTDEDDDEFVVSTSCVPWLSPGKKEKHAQRVVVEGFVSRHASEAFSRSKHEDDLQRLWNVSVDPQQEAPPRGEPSPSWKLLGFQGDDPASDLSRSRSGVLALNCMLYFANSCPSQYAEVLNRSRDEDISKTYPFACAAMHLADMLLKVIGASEVRGKPGHSDSQARRKMSSMMVVNKTTFFDIFCISFILLDIEWQKQGGTYFQFNTILESVKVKLIKGLRQRNAGTPLQLAKALQIAWRRSEDSSVEPSPRE